MSELWSAAQLIFSAIMSLIIAWIAARELIEMGRSRVLVRVRDNRRGLRHKGR